MQPIETQRQRSIIRQSADELEEHEEEPEENPEETPSTTNIEESKTLELMSQET